MLIELTDFSMYNEIKLWMLVYLDGLKNRDKKRLGYTVNKIKVLAIITNGGVF